MTIAFNQVPANQLVPFVYIEFDNSNAVQGPQIMPYKGAMIGQKTSDGIMPTLTPKLVTSADQAGQLAGFGSMLHGMAQAWFASNQYTPLYMIALDDPGSSAAAAGALTFTGTVTEAGTLALYVAGRPVQVGITAAQSLQNIATAVATAINADASLPVTAAVDGTVNTKVNITAKNAGLVANDIDVRLNYFDETTPAGLGVSITAMAGGSGVPNLVPVFSAMGDEFYNVWVNPYTDNASLSASRQELISRAGPLRQVDAVAYMAKKGSLGTVLAFGAAQNLQYFTAMATQNSPTPPSEYAAEYAAVAAGNLQRDPARPLQTLEFSWIKAPALVDRFTNQERNLLLMGGIATSRVTPGGTVAIERAVTTYKKNSFGADDPSYLDLETVATLSYVRYDFRNAILRKYPRHKLANDGTKFGAGQPILTPKIAKAECVAKFREWEEIGIVENVDQFKRDLIVERNISNPNRLDVLLPPDLVNGLRVMGVQIKFLLQEVQL